MNQFCGNVLSDIAMDPILTYEQIYSLYSKLDKTAQKKETKESINASLDKLKNIKVGSQFKHFELPVKKGNLINTSELKYKILLVEFWASWCRPCRQDNPKLLEIYKTYNDSSFEIFGVSLDTDKEAWMQAIEKDSLIWVNTIAQEGWNNQVLKSLGIQYIPSNYLIDKNGNILAINISPDDLEKKLSELLKK
jgi:thiol-disulfide isomerase/thioredoxin